METLSLAVKYRPRSLADLVGQDHISAQIAGMFNKKRMPAAIMLHGATGLGKTTVARMIASMVNCKNLDPDTLKPCGQCASCSMSDHPDVLELNAADTRGIDDVRTLIQQSKNMPSVGNKRVFILDECFPPDTDVALADGSFAKLGDIASDPLRYSVLSFNHATRSVEAQQAVDGWSKPAPDDMYEIELSDGSVQCVTGNHRWWSVTRSAYVRTDELRVDEEFLPLSECSADKRSVLEV